MNKISKLLLQMIKKYVQIVQKEWLIIIVSFLFATVDTQKLFKTCIISPFGDNAPELWLTTLRFFSIAMLISFLLACVAYFVKNKIAKFCLYLIPISIFVINDFLKYNFGHALDPLYVIMIAETNANEAREFLNVFLLNSYGIKWGIILLILVVAYLLVRFRRLRITPPPIS